MRVFFISEFFNPYQSSLKTLIIPTVLDSSQMAYVPTGDTSQSIQYLPSLNLGPSAPPQKEVDYNEVQIYASIYSDFCGNAPGSFLS